MIYVNIHIYKEHSVKAMAYRIVAIPLYTGVVLSDEQLSLIHHTVHNNVKMDALSPENIKAVGIDEAAAAYYIFREIVLAEHTAAEGIYNRMVPHHERNAEALSYFKKVGVLVTEADMPKRAVCEETPLVKEILRQISDRPVNRKQLVTLVEDIYAGTDTKHLYGAPTYNSRERKARYVGRQVIDLLDRYLKVRVGYSTAIAVLSSTYQYLGHIYIWPSPHQMAEKGWPSACQINKDDIAQVIGIRTSFINMVNKNVPDIAGKLFSGVARWCSGYFNWVVIEEPHP